MHEPQRSKRVSKLQGELQSFHKAVKHVYSRAQNSIGNMNNDSKGEPWNYTEALR